jgi:hypothetical protein
VDYIVDWARDIFRPSIMRQLMSVVDRGSRSSYTIIEEPDILSIPDCANSWYGNRSVAPISRAATIEVSAKPAFNAEDSTTESSLEPLFQSTGEHVDIRVWKAAKYESRVRGLFITGDDAEAKKHISYTGFGRFRTVHMGRCWFVIPRAQDLKTIEHAWTGSEEIVDVQDLSPQKVWISLYVQYRKDGDGIPIRELTYLALTESAASEMTWVQWNLEPNELVVSAEILGLKLREAWASSNEHYFPRYASGQTSVLCVTASDFDRQLDRVVLSFDNDREITPYARRLDSFIKSACENPRAGLYKIYATCFRYTKAVHSLTVEPYCISDPTQACVFINTEAMPSGICAYITNATSEEVNDIWLIHHLVQMLVVLWDSRRSDIKNSFHSATRDRDSKILLWIVSDPQWDSYIAVKSTLTMPGMNRVHEHLAWFRKVLLRHKCGTGTYGLFDKYRDGYRNVQSDIQKACKNCDFTWKSRADWSICDYFFCDEDFMLKRLD